MEGLRTCAAGTEDRNENRENITDRDIAQLQSDNYSIGELIEQEKTKLARLETELARTIDKPVVPIILSPCRWEPLVPRSCMGITKMTTACALWPDPGYLTISRMVARSMIRPSEQNGEDEPHAVQNSLNQDILEKRLGELETQLQELKSPAHDSTPAVVKQTSPTSARGILRTIFADSLESPRMKKKQSVSYLELEPAPRRPSIPDRRIKLRFDLESCDEEEDLNDNIGYAEKVRQATDGISNLIPKLKSDFYRRQLEKDKGTDQLAATPAPECN